MKLICPPENWQEARDICKSEAALIDWLVKKLDLKAKYDAKTDKYYLGAPSEQDGSKAGASGDDILRFTMRLPKRPTASIIDGVITLNGKMYKACSGCVGGQVYDDYWTVGASPIPPGKGYQIDLRWSWSELTGIAGRYYHILPDPIVRADGTAKRTEIGLHQDNGVPGTAGCIGIVNSDWSRLCDALDELAKFNRYLKLEVAYLCRD